MNFLATLQARDLVAALGVSIAAYICFCFVYQIIYYRVRCMQYPSKIV